MRCTHTIDKNAARWSKPAIQEVGQGHEDRACNTNDLQTLIYFTGSHAQLPSKSPVLPPEVIVPGWLGDRCQVAPPQLIHHAKQRRKAELSPSLFFLSSLYSSSALSLSCNLKQHCHYLIALRSHVSCGLWQSLEHAIHLKLRKRLDPRSQNYLFHMACLHYWIYGARVWELKVKKRFRFNMTVSLSPSFKMVCIRFFRSSGCETQNYFVY